MSTIKNQRCFTEATASARLILATGLKCLRSCKLILEKRLAAGREVAATQL